MGPTAPIARKDGGQNLYNSQTPHRASQKKDEKLTARKIREAQQKSLSFHSKRLCQHSDWDYIRSHEDELPFQREAEAAKEPILALKNNPSYSQSGIIQSYGKVNLGDEICSCCARVFAVGKTRTWEGCVSLPVGPEYPERAEGSVPFRGQCANCHWGGQGWKCPLRVGGVKIPPRRQRADLFQSNVFTNTHLGSKHDLNTIEGCANARQELQGVINRLSRRSANLQKRFEVGKVGDENAQHDEEEDDDIYDGPKSPDPVSRETSTRRTQQSRQTSDTCHSTSRNVGASIEYDDDDIYAGPSSPDPLPQETSARKTRQTGHTSVPRHSSSKNIVATIEDENENGGGDEDDYLYLAPTNTNSNDQTSFKRKTRQNEDFGPPRSKFQYKVVSDGDYVGPGHWQSMLQETTHRRNRRGSKVPLRPRPSSRVEVVIPAYQPPRQQSAREVPASK